MKSPPYSGSNVVQLLPFSEQFIQKEHFTTLSLNKDDAYISNRKFSSRHKIQSSMNSKLAYDARAN